MCKRVLPSWPGADRSRPSESLAAASSVPGISPIEHHPFRSPHPAEQTNSGHEEEAQRHRKLALALNVQSPSSQARRHRHG